jgi:hypothetical protein
MHKRVKVPNLKNCFSTVRILELSVVRAMLIRSCRNFSGSDLGEEKRKEEKEEEEEEKEEEEEQRRERKREREREREKRAREREVKAMR